MACDSEVDHHTPIEQLAELYVMLESESRQDHLTAIQVLGKVDDLEAFQKLRKRLDPVNQELQELIIAVSKLKKRLRVK